MSIFGKVLGMGSYDTFEEAELNWDAAVLALTPAERVWCWI